MNIRSLTSKLLLVSSLAVIFTSCKKDEDSPNPSNPSYTVPTAYSFTNVNYSGQTTRLGMIEELAAEMKKGNTMGTQVSAQKLKDMYANVNNQFANTDYNTSGKKLSDKTFASEQLVITAYMDALATASQSMTTGSNGTAGVVTSNDGTKKYLMSENGQEYTQLIEKGLYGSLIYYQITDVYLGDDKMNADNTTVVEGQGTAMEHHWDEAFGYLGVPVDFPTNKTGVRFWAKYADARDPLLGCNAKLMNAFLKGRAAISNKDYTTRDEQITIVRTELERVIAATAINYLNQAKTNFSDDALRNHALSECISFIKALRFNPTKKITTDEINQVVSTIGDNFYEVTVADLESAKDQLSTVYGFDSIKNQL